MLLAQVVETSKRISETSSRLRKIGLISELLRQLEPEEIPVVVSYLSGRTPQGKVGAGFRTLKEATAPAAERDSLSIHDVDAALTAVAAVKGAGSEGRRLEALRGLMSRTTAAGQHFLFRLLTGELRQGALEGLMVEAVAKAANLSADRVRRAAMHAGDIAAVARAAIENGDAGLAAYNVQLFRPVQPMLAQTADDAGEALAGLGEAALEFKMDGARVQAHRSGDDVRVYTRALNDVTPAVPEVVEAVLAMPVNDVILDGEVISLQPDGRPQPFQVTMRRFGRRLETATMRGDLPLTPFWFDVLHLQGGSLLDEPQRRRFEALAGVARPEFVIPHTIATGPEQAAAFMRESLERGHEGIMAKSRNAPYLAGARGASWLKVKHTRTLDLVILAAEWGSGRRQGWLSNLHLGARDVERGGFAMLGKTFKGLTDEMLEWQTAQFLKIEIGRDAYTVYVEPKLVAEIAFNEIQASPRYASGLALRFARVKRYRPDKPASESDTFQTVQRMAIGNPAPAAV